MSSGGRTLRAIPTLLRIGVAETVAYRAEFLVWILTTTLPLVMLALWTSVANEAPFRSFSAEDFVAYYLAALIVRNLTSTWVAWQVSEEVRTYFRDVNDHLLRVQEQLEALRDLLTSILSANLTQVSVRQNEDMRKISAWVAIVAVPTMIAGIYGMNFEHMPELEWTYGYPMALGLMLGICLLLYRRFKRAGWL